MNPSPHIEQRIFEGVVDRSISPDWASDVDRWYQLDDASFALCQSYWDLEHPQKNETDFILLASDYASNQSDLNFTQDAPPFKPMHFVHTLASIRGAPLLQLMKKRLPLICISEKTRSEEKALHFATQLLSQQKFQTIDIWTYTPQTSSPCRWSRLTHPNMRSSTTVRRKEE